MSLSENALFCLKVEGRNAGEAGAFFPRTHALGLTAACFREVVRDLGDVREVAGDVRDGQGGREVRELG